LDTLFSISIARPILKAKELVVSGVATCIGDDEDDDKPVLAYVLARMYWPKY
jgi:hypothetical protein